jgi:hypothetical protein
VSSCFCSCTRPSLTLGRELIPTHTGFMQMLHSGAHIQGPELRDNCPNSSFFSVSLRPHQQCQ